MEDKLLSALRDKRPALGCFDLGTSPEYIEVMGYVGFDFVILDQMWTALDWNVAAHLVRASLLFEMSPIIRTQAYPWTTQGMDDRLAVDTARAFGIGAVGVMMSVSSAREVEQCVAVQEGGWHRRVHIMPFSKRTWEGRTEQLGGETVVIPLLESEGSIREIEEIVAVPGLRCVFVGVSDMSRMLGHPFDYEHPEVWRFVDKVANLAHSRGVALAANTGYEVRTIDDIAARVQRLYEHGVQVISLQPASAMLQFWCQELIQKASRHVPLAARGGGPMPR